MSGEPVARLWRPRLVAYEPLGPLLGELPHPFSWTFTQSDDSRPTLNVHYPLEGAHSEWIKGGCELAVEYPIWGGGDDDRATWVEPINARMVAWDKDRDRMDRVETFRYSYIGIDYLLDRAWIQERDPQDPEEGDQKAERTFPDPPATAYFGKVIKKLWDEVATATGWGGVGADALDTNFTNTNDTDGAPWTIEVPMVVGLDEPLSNVVKRYVEAGAATPNWHGRTMRAFDGILLEDLTDSVVLRDADFVSRAPQVVDWQPVATHCRIIGAKGRTWDFERPGDPELPHGTPEMIMRQYTDCETEDRAQRYADQAFAESVIVEQLSAEINFGASRIKPWQDYNLWSKVRRDRGRLSDESKTIDTVGRVVRSISVTVDGQGVRGHVILGDHRRRLGERAARQLAEMGRGSRVGPGGLSLPPGDDPRIPDITAEPAPTLTATTVADHNNRPRGQIEITQLWDTSVPALDPDGAASDNPIKIKEWVFGTRRSGKKWKETLRVSADDTSTAARVETLFDPDETIEIRRYAVSHEGKISAKQTLTSVTWSADEDAALGVDAIVDGANRNAAIRAARLAAAGAGAAFTSVSGVMALDLTSTTPVVDYGVAGKPTSGRKAARAGDEIVVDCTAARPVGSAATLRVTVRFYLADSTATSVTAISSAVTASDATYSGTATAPTGTVSFGVKVDAQSLGAGATLRVKHLNVDRRTVETRLKDSAVSNRTVANGAITGGAAGLTSKIASRTIAASNIVVDTITANEIAANTITANEIAANTITTTELAADAIDGMTINGVTINGATIAALTVTSPVYSTLAMQISGATLAPFAGSGFLTDDWSCSGDFDAVTVTETSARAGKADLRKMLDPRRLLKVPTWTFRKARDTSAPRQVGLIAEEVADAGLEELVTRDGSGKPIGLKYSRVVAVLLDIVREQDERIERLEKGAA